jgi:hypothetical protein
MFYSLKELVDELIGIIKDKKIEIENYEYNNITLKIHLMIRNNNFAFINLPKVELNENDKYNYLFDEISKLKKINEEKDNEINTLKKKINELEINNLKLKNYIEKKFNDFENKFSNIKNENKILNYKSLIFKDNSEIDFILSNINDKPISLSLLYSSSIDGENEEKFKSSYIGKNDILVLIKTKENRRFGGYAHESFLLDIFDKKDLKAFLFNVDNKNIYKSK